MLTNDALQQMVEQNLEATEEGHSRLRKDYRSIERRVESMENAQVANALHFSKIDALRTDVNELRFTPQVVLTIVLTCLSIAGGMWASTYSLRSDVRDIRTLMSAQAELEHANTRLSEERAAQVAESIRQIRATMELQRMKLEALGEAVLKLQR